MNDGLYTEYLTMLQKLPKHELDNVSTNIGRTLCSYIKKNQKTHYYQFIDFLGKGGEAVVMLIRDPVKEKNFVAKLMFPIRTRNQQSIYNQGLQTKEDYNNRNIDKKLDHQLQRQIQHSDKIGKKDKSMMDEFVNYRHKKKEKRGNSEALEAFKEMSGRIERSVDYQEIIHNECVKRALNFGYVPNIYELSGPPFVYSLQEYIEETTNSMQWVQDKTESEILIMFLNLVKLIRTIFHEKGYIHTDIKPSNILINKENKPIVVDFTSVRCIDEKRLYTTIESSLHDIRYSSNEQIAHAIDRDDLSDNFSLAATMHSFLRRKEPPPRDRNETPFYDIFRPNIIENNNLREIFLKATCKDINKRYASIDQFENDISEVVKYLDGKTVIGAKKVVTTEKIIIEKSIDKDAQKINIQDVKNICKNPKYINILENHARIINLES